MCGASIACAALFNIFFDRSIFFERRKFPFWLGIHERWVLCADGGRIFHRLVSSSVHFKPCFFSTTCQCWGLTHSYFGVVSGKHLHFMMMVELAWWVLVDKSIIARMANNDLIIHRSDYKWHKYIPLNQINVSLTYLHLNQIPKMPMAIEHNPTEVEIW